MKLVITKPAKRDLAALDKPTQRRIAEALERMIQSPRSVDMKKIQGEDAKWRLRVGDFRVLLEIDNGEAVVYALHVLHRREAYRDNDCTEW